MHSKKKFHKSLFRIISTTLALAMAIPLALGLLFAQSAQAQSLTVIHNFTGGPDGSQPGAGVTLDAAGNIYGTTTGFTGGLGTVFQLKGFHGAWLLNNIVTFNGNNGVNPEGGVVFGPDGALYGTTYLGGSANAGVVFSVKPAATACKSALCPWAETILYQFTGGNDGASPAFNDLTFDSAGNIYGTTSLGGAYGAGTVFKLTPSNGGWTESVLYSFAFGDASYPWGGVVFDRSGSLYGTTLYGPGSGCGGSGCGTVYQLTPTDSGWEENTLHIFDEGSNGYFPCGNLVVDQSGNVFGTTWQGGGASGYSGTVFELSPAGGSWSFALLYGWPNGSGGPLGALAMDNGGVLYGTTSGDGAYGAGSVFKLTPSNGSWTYTSLHDFSVNDGAGPISNVVWDANGNLYGTTQAGGTYGNGVVWEISP
ncbi:MAG: choice-of-anchor tandem repeat GloVer-containing protein [Candidatus Korobacteraceae bacterium]